MNKVTDKVKPPLALSAVTRQHPTQALDGEAGWALGPVSARLPNGFLCEARNWMHGAGVSLMLETSHTPNNLFQVGATLVHFAVKAAEHAQWDCWLALVQVKSRACILERLACSAARRPQVGIGGGSPPFLCVGRNKKKENPPTSTPYLLGFLPASCGLLRCSVMGRLSAKRR